MEQKIFFNNSKGDRFCGILNNPSGDKSKPIMITVHGFSSQKNAKVFVLLRNLLEAKNISTFRIDLYAHGESDGKLEELTISEAVDDILNANQYVKDMGYKKIGLIGTSFGATASIMVASKTKDLFALALKSPIPSYSDRAKLNMTERDIQEWKEKGFRILVDDGKKFKLNYSYFKDFKNNDGYKAATLIKIPTIIVHGELDEFVPVEQSIKFSRLVPKCKLIILENCGHRFISPEHINKMSYAFVNFINEND